MVRTTTPIHLLDFIRGYLVAAATRRTTVTVVEICRMSNINCESLPTLLEELHKRTPGEPPLGAIITHDIGTIGYGYDNLLTWQEALCRVWTLWYKRSAGYKQV